MYEQNTPEDVSAQPRAAESYLQKNLKVGYDKYEIRCVKQFGHAEYKFQNSIFVRPALHGARQISYL